MGKKINPELQVMEENTEFCFRKIETWDIHMKIICIGSFSLFVFSTLLLDTQK
jgi:hypothetical protein